MLIGVDYYTRFMLGSVLETKGAIEIRDKLVLWFKKFGNPEEIIVDQGLEFNNKGIEEMLIARDIKKHVIAVDSHQSNGRVERLNRTIRSYFRKIDADKSADKKELLGRAIGLYNNALHSAINMSPAEAWKIGESSKEVKIRNSKDGPYAKSFKKRFRDKYINNQIVAVKKTPLHKEDQIFGQTGKIIADCGKDSYIVQIENKRAKKSHRDLNLLNGVNQSKLLEGGC